MAKATVRQLGLIGAGNMGEALLKGVLAGGLVTRRQVLAADASPSRLEMLRQTYGIRTTGVNRTAAAWGDIVVIAVKPAMVKVVLAEIRPALTTKKVLVSIAAGVSLGRIRSEVPKGVRLVRAMPNIAVVVGEGMTVLATEQGRAFAGLELVREIFGTVGKTVVMDESLLNAVTGLSGSGPAYIFLLIEALADGGVRMGLPKDAALLLAAQTVLGAARMTLETQQHPATLKNLVASPAGTTMAGLRALEAKGFRSAVIAAVEAAARRAEELG